MSVFLLIVILIVILISLFPRQAEIKITIKSKKKDALCDGNFFRAWYGLQQTHFGRRGGFEA
jgi:hypothetical protein